MRARKRSATFGRAWHEQQVQLATRQIVRARGQAARMSTIDDFIIAVLARSRAAR